MRLQITAYDLDGRRMQTLQEARNIAFNSSALTFDLPKGSTEIGYFDGPIALGVEIEALSGKRFGRLQYTGFGEVDTRFIFRSSSQSLTEATGVWSFTAPALATVAFAGMPILPQFGDVTTYGAADTPYTIIANRVAEAKSRGNGYNITVVDSGGWGSPNPATHLEFDDFATLDAFYNALRDSKEADFFWVGTTLYVMAPGVVAIDRSAETAFQVDDFSDIPVNIDYSNTAGTILGIGDGISELYPASAPGNVVSVQYSGVSDTTILHQLVISEYGNRLKAAREITASLALSAQQQDGSPRFLPYRDYHRGTLVSFPLRGGGAEKVTVADVTLTRDISPDFSGNIVLDTKLKSKEVRLNELVKSAVGGVTNISGNGSAA